MALAILFKPQPRSGTVMYSVRRVSMAICTQRNPKPVLLAFIAAAIVFAPAAKKDFMALGRFPLLAFVAFKPINWHNRWRIPVSVKLNAVFIACRSAHRLSVLSVLRFLPGSWWECSAVGIPAQSAQSGGASEMYQTRWNRTTFCFPADLKRLSGGG